MESMVARYSTASSDVLGESAKYDSNMPPSLLSPSAEGVPHNSDGFLGRVNKGQLIPIN